MFDKDKANLLAIIDCCTKIENFTAAILDADDFFAAEKTFDAVLMNFVVIGESVGRLSENIKAKESQISWVKIKGFRNLVAYDYFGVDAEEVWQIIKDDLPNLEEGIHLILSNK